MEEARKRTYTADELHKMHTPDLKQLCKEYRLHYSGAKPVLIGYSFPRTRPHIHVHAHVQVHKHTHIDNFTFGQLLFANFMIDGACTCTCSYT